MALNTPTEYTTVTARMAKPIHWPALVAGAFIALSLFVVSVVLAQGCDVDVVFQSAYSGGSEVGAIIWGAVAAIICFGIGAVCANAFSDMPKPHGWVQGLMVWAIVVPVLVYWVGVGIGPRLGQHSSPQNENRPFAASAIDTMHNAPGAANAGAQPETGGSSTYISHPQAGAWWMILSLGLGLVSAVGCGHMCGNRNTTASSTGYVPPRM